VNELPQELLKAAIEHLLTISLLNVNII